MDTRTPRYDIWVRWGSIAVIAVSLLLIMGALAGSVLEPFKDWIDSLGAWAPVAFGVIYVIAVVAFVPGSILTLAAGALFGLWIGTLVVSLASTSGAAFAFLIGRYVARERVAQRAAENPKFEAVDRAIDQGGWKIVAMLRLSPAIPFNLQNYLYGLTSLRFWTCVLTSWIAMLPGTFMYVYVGYAATQAASAGEDGKTIGEWILLGFGLVITIVLTVYITKLARKQLQQQTDVEEGPDATDKSQQDETDRPRKSPVPLLIVAVLLAVLAGCAQAYKADLNSFASGLFGPPEVEGRERYDEKTPGASVDHTALDELLAAQVDDGGLVDYEAILAEEEKLNRYIASLGEVDFGALGRDEKLALLINAYNAFTIRLILDYWNEGELASIKDIPESKRWEDQRWRIGGETYSLDQIEHEEIRVNFKEPRIHFALVCAALGCPPLRTEAYTGEKLESQLADQAEYVHSHDRWYRYDESAGRVSLTMLYDWYGGDFEQVAGSVLAYAARYDPALKRTLDRGDEPTIAWLDYDWSLNRQNR